MKIHRCSASSLRLYQNCPFGYFLNYILGLRSKAGKAALQGNIVHQALEWMGKLKKRNKTNVDPMWLLDRAWDDWVDKTPHIAIRKTTTRIDKITGEYKEAADYKKCRIAMESVLNDKFYNPYCAEVLDTEKWFALEMPGKEWECVDENGKVKQFAIRGFIDLLHRIDEDTIEIVDWKTGSRTDLSTKEPIDEFFLTQEIQPRLYHLAIYLLYPQYKNIIITFYYTNDQGPITISFSQEDIAQTISVLYRFFTTIRKDTLIRRSRSWKCKMCSFNKDDVCQKIWSDLHTLGESYVATKYVADNGEIKIINM